MHVFMRSVGSGIIKPPTLSSLSYRSQNTGWRVGPEKFPVFASILKSFFQRQFVRKKNTLKGCPLGFFRRGLKEWWRVKKSGVILMDGLCERGVSPDVLLMLWLLNQKRHIRMSDMILALFFFFFFSELYDNILSMFSMNDYIWDY